MEKKNNNTDQTIKSLCQQINFVFLKFQMISFKIDYESLNTHSYAHINSRKKKNEKRQTKFFRLLAFNYC